MQQSCITKVHVCYLTVADKTKVQPLYLYHNCEKQNQMHVHYNVLKS